MQRSKCLLYLCLCAVLPLAAQNANVSGAVQDTQRASIGGSKITLTNVDTGAQAQTTSIGDGRFILPPVPPGNYEIRAEAAGFTPTRITAIRLEVDESRVINIELKIASVAESVEVSATPPELTTDRADRSLVMEQQFVESIPLVIRNPLQLINFSPGVTKGDDGLSGTNSTSESRTNTWRINGAKGATTDILIDGATDTTAYYNQAASVPDVEAIQEYRVYTDSYAPEFGRTSGGMVSYALRSGSNAFHGIMYDFLRNSDLDANGFNSDKAGLPKPEFRRNQFGFTLGGPMWVPKLYNGRNKTFFFVAYEGLRDSDEGSFTSTMPTALQRAGNFSQTYSTTGALIVMYDPTTTQQNPAAPAGTTQYIRTPFPGNIIPASELNPIAQKLLSYYPMPNQPGIGLSATNNFFSNAPSTDKNDQVDTRVDQQLSPKQSLFFHYDWFTNHINYPDYFGNGLSPEDANDRIPGVSALGHHTWSISPTLIFEQHFSWSHSESNRNEAVALPPTELGFPASIAPGVTAGYTPQVSLSNVSTLGNYYPKEKNTSSVYQYGADTEWIKGIHTFKFGADIRYYPTTLWDPEQLSISASGAFTGGPNPNAPVANSESSVADLLLGQATVSSGYEARTVSHHEYYAGYAQDTARLTRKLTLTFGLRIGSETGEVENQNQMNYLNLSSPSPIAPLVPALPGLHGGVGIPGLDGTNRQLQIPQGPEWDPRIGLAYNLDSKTVIRAGFGIFHHPVAALGQYPNSYGTTRTETSIDAAPNGVTPLLNLSNPFPSGLLPPWGTADGLSIALGQNVAGALRTQQIPYQENYSFDVQREVFRGLVVTAAYAGNEGVHLMTPVNLNQLPDSDLALGSQLLNVVANPFYNVITDPTSTLSAPTVQYGQLLRPYPEFLNFKAVNVGAGHSSYNAGQLVVERRFAQGLALMFAYTHSKAIDNVGEMTSVAGTQNGFQDNNCFACDRSLSDQNQPNTVRLSFRYDLPFGPGKPWLNQGFASRVLGSWAVGTFYTYDTGHPVAVTASNFSNSLGGGTAMRPDATGASAVVPGGPQITNNGLYFNPAAFAAVPSYQFGNVSRYLPDVNNPSDFDTDMLIEKSIPIRERMHLTFRAELFNAFNNVNFSGPVTSITSSSFGRISLTQSNNPRQVQFALRLAF
jgi:Carboxypeptidase regulatory-like domain